MYYANEESDDVIGGFTKTVQHSIKNISINIGAVFFKLGTRTVHHKISKMTLSCCCHDNSYAAGPALIKTKIPRFYLKQGSSTRNGLMGESWGNMGVVCSELDPLSQFRRLQMGIFGFSQRETGVKNVAMATT